MTNTFFVFSDLPTVFAHFLKVIWQGFTLFFALLCTLFPDYVLVQNPPAVPALGVCYIFCQIFRAKFVIDWHNYAYSILALSLGRQHILVKVSRTFEYYFGRKATSNICVTKAMMDDLKTNHGIKATTFYDRPPDIFQAVSNKQKHELFLSLGIEYELFLRGCGSNETVFTKHLDDSSIILRENRPALIVSSTSWTEDEDFSILLTALEGRYNQFGIISCYIYLLRKEYLVFTEYEKAKKVSKNLPHLLCAITGKGPLKEFYINIIRRKKWENVEVITPWLEAKDYPVFLGDYSLHFVTNQIFY